MLVVLSDYVFVYTGDLCVCVGAFVFVCLFCVSFLVCVIMFASDDCCMFFSCFFVC